jgi:hypothetical protein
MVLHNASDSLADLLQVKAQRAAAAPINGTMGGGLSSARDSVADMRGFGKQMSFRKKKNTREDMRYDDFCYELEEQAGGEEEDDAPIWEMDLSHAWSGARLENSARETAAPGSFADDEGNVYYTDSVPRNEGPHLSIPECERIFTVPEVYDDLMKDPWERYTVRERLRKFLENCWTSKEMDKRGAFSAVDEEEIIDVNSKEQKMIRMNIAVQLYMEMPAAARQMFNPSLYKIRLDENGDLSRPSIAGEQHQIFNGDSQYGAISALTPSDARSSMHTTTERSDKAKRHVHFSELKRVLTMRKFTPEEAVQVWYQREDFEHFKAEMTLLIRDMEAPKELASMWLDTDEAERRRSAASTEKFDGSDEDKKRHTKSKSWWHDYDHSRRGLERYASAGQARQILASYKVAVHKVLAEQRRQNLLSCLLVCVPDASVKDPDKIAEIYHEYTAWSMDLALAAGASDADAVRTNFDDATRKSREYYILKQVIRNGYKVHKHMPQFMMPKCITPKGFLDESETLLRRGSNELDATKRRRENIIQTMSNSIRIKAHQTLTGEEAREEMSNLANADLAGPISPLLAPMFEVKEGAEDVSISSLSPGATNPQGKRQSLAAKAKNFPFQN